MKAKLIIILIAIGSSLSAIGGFSPRDRRPDSYWETYSPRCFAPTLKGDTSANDNSLFLLLPHANLLGTYGGIMTPSARFGPDRYAFLSVGYMPYKERIVTDNWEDVGEMHITASIMLTSYMNFSLSLVHPLNQGDYSYGIGDRSIKAKFWLLKEKKYLPSIALGIHDFLGSNNFQSALYLVGSKSFKLNLKLNLNLNLGYGFNLHTNNLIIRTLFEDNPTQNNPVITGAFGGADLNYKIHHLLLEYDTEQINAGYSIDLLNNWKSSWRVQASVYTLGFSSITGQLTVLYRFGDRMVKI